jgi:hypothetical protein
MKTGELTKKIAKAAIARLRKGINRCKGLTEISEEIARPAGSNERAILDISHLPPCSLGDTTDLTLTNRGRQAYLENHITGQGFQDF